MEKVECFVDTGAEHSFCTFSLYERLKEEFTLSSKKCIMESFNGSTEIESIGRIDMSYCTQLKAWKTCVIGIAPETLQSKNKLEMRLGRDLLKLFSIDLSIPMEHYGFQHTFHEFDLYEDVPETKNHSKHKEGMSLIKQLLEMNSKTEKLPAKVEFPRINIPDQYRKRGIVVNQYNLPRFVHEPMKQDIMESLKNDVIELDPMDNDKYGLGYFSVPKWFKVEPEKIPGVPGKIRIVEDFRALNKVIMDNPNAIPRIVELFHRILEGKPTIFTRIDLTKAY
jgi:hypothetical protein